MKKKIVALMLVTCLLFTITGCKAKQREFRTPPEITNIMMMC